METILNLHNNKNLSTYKIKASIILVLILWSCTIFSQDSIVLPNSIDEKKQLQFQEHFFEALTQKAINNYQKAIEELEECNTLEKNNLPVLFELSKNYLKLNKTPESLTYIIEALGIEPNNLWLLEHLVAIHKKDKNYTEAITIQEQIAEDYPKKRKEIVYLHLKNRDNSSAKKVLSELAEAKLLDSRLRRIRERLNNTKKIKTTKPKNIITGSVEEEFIKNKTFNNLKELLTKLNTENNTSLLKYSNEGLNIFPAQPFVYLMNGKANNKQKNYKKAIKTLENGIDFVIDDPIMEKNFYKELLAAYKALSDTKNILKYQKKINEHF